MAKELGTPATLPSRAAAAMLHALSQGAAGSGHCYLDWPQLSFKAVQAMAHAHRQGVGPGPWPSDAAPLELSALLAMVGQRGGGGARVVVWGGGHEHEQVGG